MTTTHTPRGALRDVCHLVIADLATQTNTPNVAQILSATRHRVGPRHTNPAQVRTQLVAGITAAYFRLYAPDDPWRFTGRDLCLDETGMDLTWKDPEGRVMADTVLAGHRPTDREVAAAVRGLRSRTTRTHDDHHVEMRLLVPRAPELSCLVAH